MENYFLYLLISITMVIMPGTDTALVTKNTLAGGSRGGVATVMGTAAGILVHTTAAALGLSAIIAQSVFLFELIKYAGAIYLFYLGIQAFWIRKKQPGGEQAAVAEEPAGAADTRSRKAYFLQGTLSNILNPKSVVFFMTFMPQFIDPHQDTIPQLILLSMTLVILAIVWFLTLVLMIGHVRTWFSRPAFQNAFQRITGSMLILLGIKLVMEER